ncbi:hypothetical protein K9L97_03945 [Candidatus Woesearchaeota archaeon]|nr:hypothetical protein [Candidatus Woesearchaeota archaeon]
MKHKLIIIIFFCTLFLIVACQTKTNETLLIADMKDSSIISGESTQIIIEVSNNGDVVLDGELEIYSEDEENVQIEYSDDERISINLAPEENIKRVIPVTGKTSSLRTDYLITVNLIGSNKSILGSAKTVLIVKKE